MSDFSSLTHKFRANVDNQVTGTNKISKRNRQPLSCAPCRVKKLKCDRGHPCETCIKRGDPTICTYGKNVSASTNSSSKPETNGTNSKGKAQERLRHLEHLIMQMVDQNGHGLVLGSQPPASTNAPGSGSQGGLVESESGSEAPNAAGRLQLASSGAQYVGSTHWSAILDNIQEIKAALGTENTPNADLEDTEDSETAEVVTLFDSGNGLSLAQILSQALPSRLQVDRRLSTYFKNHYLVIQFIHTGQFQRQYEEFWRNPLETSPLWISILFAICCMSATLNHVQGSEDPTPEDRLSPRMSFLQAACLCIKLGGYVRPKKWLLEALGLYAQCQYMATMDPSKEVGVVFSMVVRLAYQSGYHREPSNFPHLSVFEGEMRRRCWAMCRQFDLMVSFQLGLPNLITPDSWDTKAPSNLLDADFDENSAVLPPSRPETDPTQILYFIVKLRLMTAFGRICNHALSFREAPRQEIMDLDAEVRAVYKTVPDILHVRPLSKSFADPSYLIMVRLNCEFLYQKCLLVLHRKYMTQGGHPDSSEAAITAATTIVTYMLDIYKEFKPGGQLYADRWMLSSFTMNDFYLATMVLCLSLSIWRKSHPEKNVGEDEKVRSRIELLSKAYGVCEESSAASKEAKRITGVLKIILGEYVLAAGSGLQTRSAGISPEDILERRDMFRIQPIAFFPSSSDFNLAPLSLSDSQATVNPPHTMQAHQTTANNSVDFEQFSYPQTETRDSNQIDASMSPNPFTPFMSFNNSTYGYSPVPTTSNGMTNSASNPLTTSIPAIQSPFLPSGLANGQGANTNMGIDWALLDQWMAIPDADFMQTLSPNATMPSSRPDGPGSNIPTTAPMHDDDNDDWTSTPIRFLGTTTLLQNQETPNTTAAGFLSSAVGAKPSTTSSGSNNNTDNFSPGTDSLGYSTSTSSGRTQALDQYPQY
ncbi:hypothetical protein LTR84_003894 [Exophiala bonariae]|uniref:Zn(2)-C6 fungal-type domain-containing protein n=1 Tax=Exophiala bonariae TaxID=1690606 RepID=A0AAV9N7L2_9EURO|nr:hypothetical protein LTR84_003894 [Exophiala bonariae]